MYHSCGLQNNIFAKYCQLQVRFLPFWVNIVTMIVTIIFAYIYQFRSQLTTNIPQLVLAQYTPLTFKKNIENF